MSEPSRSSRTRPSLIDEPGSSARRSTRIWSPGATRYCLPPLTMTAVSEPSDLGTNAILPIRSAAPKPTRSRRAQNHAEVLGHLHEDHRALVAERVHAARTQENPIQRVNLLEDDPGSAHDACERILRDANRHQRLVREQLIQPGKKSYPSADDDAAFDDVVGELRWRRVKRRLDGAHDIDQHTGERLTDVGGRHLDRLGKTGD